MGETVFKGHRSYDLMLCLQVGGWVGGWVGSPWGHVCGLVRWATPGAARQAACNTHEPSPLPGPPECALPLPLTPPMQLGIRYTVTTINKLPPPQALSDSHFQEKVGWRRVVVWWYGGLSKGGGG